ESDREQRVDVVDERDRVDDGAIALLEPQLAAVASRLTPQLLELAGRGAHARRMPRSAPMDSRETRGLTHRATLCARARQVIGGRMLSTARATRSRDQRRHRRPSTPRRKPARLAAAGGGALAGGRGGGGGGGGAE